MKATSVEHGISPFMVLIDEDGFIDWLVEAEPGARLIYYRGHLAHDRKPSAAILSNSERADLRALAHRVFVAHEQGLVIPVQKRLCPRDWLYCAIRADRPCGGGIVRSAAAMASPPAPAALCPSPEIRVAAR
jgi:hypothetical protein